MPHETCLLLHNTSLVEHHEVRNPLHAKARGKLRMRFRVDLEHDRLPLHIGRSFRNFRSSGSTGAAPGSPEIHQHGHGCVLHHVVKHGDISSQRLRDWRQVSLARAAPTRIGKVLRRYTILLTAL